MKTTTATYNIKVITGSGFVSFVRTMPTRPTSSKGQKTQTNKLEKWAMSNVKDWKEIIIERCDS